MTCRRIQLVMAGTCSPFEVLLAKKQGTNYLLAIGTSVLVYRRKYILVEQYYITIYILDLYVHINFLVQSHLIIFPHYQARKGGEPTL